MSKTIYYYTVLDKQKKYIGGSDHGQIVDGAVFETAAHPDFLDDDTKFVQIADFETEPEPEAQKPRVAKIWESNRTKTGL